MQLKPQLSDLKKTKALLFRQKEETYLKDTNYRRQEEQVSCLYKFHEW